MLKLELSFDDWANMIAGLHVAITALTRENHPDSKQDIADLHATLARVEDAVANFKREHTL
jgi:hypothetical protein